MLSIKYKKPVDYAGWTFYIFGILALLLGLIGLIKPEITLALLGFDVVERGVRSAGDYTIVFMLASSMASFNMGIYYIFAALNDVKIFYGWTVPCRVLTFTVFTLAVIFDIAPTRFLGVAVWELIGAFSTGIALNIDKKKRGE